METGGHGPRRKVVAAAVGEGDGREDEEASDGADGTPGGGRERRVSSWPVARSSRLMVDTHEDAVQVLEHLEFRVLLALLEMQDRAVDCRAGGVSESCWRECFLRPDDRAGD
jgi:hypothetical protein